MAAMNPILRLRQVFRTAGADSEQADEAADAIVDYSYSRRETELMFQHERALMRQYLAEMRNQLLLAIMIATGLIIGAVSLLIALLVVID